MLRRDGGSESAGAASDLHGLFAAGEPPLSCKSTQAFSPRSAAFVVRSYSGGSCMHAAELPNSRLRECEEVGAQAECESNLPESTGHKTPMAVPLTRAVNRFP